MSQYRSPNHEGTLYAVSSITGEAEYLTSTNHVLDTTGGGGGGGGTSAVDNSAFTAGTTAGTPAMGFYHSTIDTVTDGRTATIGMTSKRAMFVNLQDAAGAALGTTANPLSIQPPASGALATNITQIGSTNIVTAGVAGTQAGGGNQATNSNVSTNVYPTLIAGSDYAGTPKIQNIRVDTSGYVQVKLPTWSVSSQTALTTTATVSGAAGAYGGGSFLNLNSVPSYIQIFDTTGAVTLGTTPPTFVQPIPANSTAANGSGFVFELSGGITIYNGIKIAATTTPTGATTVSTGLTGFIVYQ